MSNTTSLLDKALKLCSPPTKYRLAKELGIKPGTVSRCYLHGGTLDNETAFKLAKMLRMDVGDVIAYMEEDRAKDDKKKEFWRRQLPRVLPSIAIGTGLLLGLGGTLFGGFHGVGNANSTEAKAHLTIDPSIHYAQLDAPNCCPGRTLSSRKLLAGSANVDALSAKS